MYEDVKHWWDNSGTRKLKYPRKNQSQCHCVHQQVSLGQILIRGPEIETRNIRYMARTNYIKLWVSGFESDNVGRYLKAQQMP